MSATYIYQHTSGYIFRYCIPPDIQPLIKEGGNKKTPQQCNGLILFDIY